VAGSDSLHRIELGSEAFDVEANAADIVMPADALDTKSWTGSSTENPMSW